MKKIYREVVPVPVRIRWEQELIEDKNNFYMKLSPVILGGAGRNKITKKGGSYVRMVDVERAAERLQAKIKRDRELKAELKKVAVAAMKGKKMPTTPLQTKTAISREDIELGREMRKLLAEAERNTQRAAERKKADMDKED